MTMRFPLALPLLALPALLALPLLASPPAAAQETEPQQDWMVHMDKGEDGWRYIPSRIVLVPGGTVQLMVFGDGQFSIVLDHARSYEADIASTEGTVRTAEFAAPEKPGEYPFHDKYHPEARGVLVVAEPSERDAAQEPAESAAPVIGVVPGGYESQFAPARLEVAPGAEVTFRTNGTFAHTLHAEDGSFTAGNLSAGEERTFTAPMEPGEYPFVCLYHEDQGMRGVLVVTAAATPAGDTAGAADSDAPPDGSADEATGGDPAAATPALGVAATVVALGVLAFAARRTR